MREAELNHYHYAIGENAEGEKTLYYFRGDFDNHEIESLLKKEGIKNSFEITYSPFQAGLEVRYDIFNTDSKLILLPVYEENIRRNSRYSLRNFGESFARITSYEELNDLELFWDHHACRDYYTYASVYYFDSYMIMQDISSYGEIGLSNYDTDRNMIIKSEDDKNGKTYRMTLRTSGALKFESKEAEFISDKCFASQMPGKPKNVKVAFNLDDSFLTRMIKRLSEEIKNCEQAYYRITKCRFFHFNDIGINTKIIKRFAYIDLHLQLAKAMITSSLQPEFMDTVLYHVKEAGPSAHVGYDKCFQIIRACLINSYKEIAYVIRDFNMGLIKQYCDENLDSPEVKDMLRMIDLIRTLPEKEPIIEILNEKLLYLKNPKIIEAIKNRYITTIHNICGNNMFMDRIKRSFKGQISKSTSIEELNDIIDNFFKEFNKIRFKVSREGIERSFNIRMAHYAKSGITIGKGFNKLAPKDLIDELRPENPPILKSTDKNSSKKR